MFLFGWIGIAFLIIAFRKAWLRSLVDLKWHDVCVHSFPACVSAISRHGLVKGRAFINRTSDYLFITIKYQPTCSELHCATDGTPNPNTQGLEGVIYREHKSLDSFYVNCPRKVNSLDG